MTNSTWITVGSTSISKELLVLDPENPDRRMVIPLRALVWWDEQIADMAIALHLTTSEVITVKFRRTEKWADLATSLWFALEDR